MVSINDASLKTFKNPLGPSSFDSLPNLSCQQYLPELKDVSFQGYSLAKSFNHAAVVVEWLFPYLRSPFFLRQPRSQACVDRSLFNRRSKPVTTTTEHLRGRGFCSSGQDMLSCRRVNSICPDLLEKYKNRGAAYARSIRLGKCGSCQHI